MRGGGGGGGGVRVGVLIVGLLVHAPGAVGGVDELREGEGPLDHVQHVALGVIGVVGLVLGRPLRTELQNKLYTGTGTEKCISTA